MTDTHQAGSREYVLTVDCPDGPGLVYAVSGFVASHAGNIVESQQFDDRLNGRFFLRVHVEVVDAAVTIDELRRDFQDVAALHRMNWQLWDAHVPYRTLVMVSTYGHCLNDLLFRWKSGGLQVEIPAIVSNHADLEPLAAAYGVPFHHIPVTPHSKSAAEEQLLELVESLDIHLVVLARYMQVLSDDLCKQLEGRAINIHHSFLPGFKGAKPYHQAFDRGVKLVGASAHYVTPDLDEGPIIEQEVIRIDHTYDPRALATVGQDAEALALSRAVRWHSEGRVLLNERSTVVFR